jgi:hypothetical protein
MTVLLPKASTSSLVQRLLMGIKYLSTLWDKIQLDFLKFRTQTISIIILRDTFICEEHIRLHELTHEETNIFFYSVDFSPQANYTDRATAACRRS